jgi:undecaprenyl diphosphate synthase
MCQFRPLTLHLKVCAPDVVFYGFKITFRGFRVTIGKIDWLAPKDAEEAALLTQVDSRALPRHIAIIMDGNGRWARKRHLPRGAGHRAGARAVREVTESSARLGLEALTLYAFSIENWKRPADERETLWKLLREFLREELETLNRNNIRFRTIGRIEQLPETVQRSLHNTVEQTASNTGMLLNLALNYGARAELVDAFNSILDRLRGNGLNGYRVDEQAIAEHLYTNRLPDPDLLIRTSGELRVSNFLLWQIAYSEIWVTETLWPDFGRKHLLQAVIDFQKRERRYGGLSARG